MELTSAIRKEVASLRSARARREAGAFVAEGTKCVADTMGHFTLRRLVATASWLEAHPAQADAAAENIVVAPRRDMERMSDLSTAPEVMAVYDMPVWDFRPGDLDGTLTLALDGVQDPGNVGTIIRAADWFGVTTLLCSTECADAYSQKAVMASMGSIARVRVWRGDLAQALDGCAQVKAGTFLDGTDIYTTPLPRTGIIVMGSEGNGISGAVASRVDLRLRIPSFPPGAATAESLNVGMAASIVLSEWRRRDMAANS